MRSSISFFHRGVIPTLRLSIETFIRPPPAVLLVRVSKGHASCLEAPTEGLEEPRARSSLAAGALPVGHGWRIFPQCVCNSEAECDSPAKSGRKRGCHIAGGWNMVCVL